MLLKVDMMPDLSIIIVNWNTGKLLAECIASIYEKTKGVNYEIIIVDNASTDKSLELINKKLENLHVIREAVNHGFSRANNIGLRRSSGRYICFLNPDTLLINDAMSMMIGKIEEHGDNFAAAGPLIIKPNGAYEYSCSRSFPNIIKLIYQKSALEKIPFLPTASKFNTYGRLEHNYLVPAISGSCMLLKKTVIDKIGGYDEKYFMYGEDMDLCFSVGKYGYSIIFVADAKVMHYGGQSSKAVSCEMELASIRSECYYFMKNHSKTTEAIYRALLVPVYLIKIIPHIIYFGNKTHRIRVFLFWDIVKLAAGISL